MEQTLIVGIIIFAGVVVAAFCTRIGLPKVTGYILAGIMLNPNLTPFIPKDFVEHTDFVTNIALAFITFSVGGTLFFPKIRALGKEIILITLFEAECAFLFVAIAFIIIGPYIISQYQTAALSAFVPLSVLVASLASPTDPSATLAIEHEYHSKGEVTSTIMGVAAFDDVLGIINYSIAISFCGFIMMNHAIDLNSMGRPFFNIVGAVILGVIFSLILNYLTRIIKKETEGFLITLIISLLALCFGMAQLLSVDELLSTMIMGIVVVNYNLKRKMIFHILERYTEELIFVLFFTLSAMHLDFKVLISNYPLILLFVVFSSLGKVCGTFVGGMIAESSTRIRKYVAGGLIPQGGIVIGLALTIRHNPALDSISVIILNVIIGATIIHEIIGPLVSKLALEKAGEIAVSEKRT